MPYHRRGRWGYLDNPKTAMMIPIFSSQKLPSVIAVAAALGLPCAPVFAAVGDPSGSEFQVNTYTLADQQNPSVAMNAAGGFVVVWESSVQGANDTSGIYAQRYDAAGAAQGGEFQVNAITSADEQLPKVAMNAAGNFAVVWESIDQDGNLHIYARCFSADGTPLGGDIEVTGTAISTSTLTTKPSVAIESSGNFVVAWENYDDANANEDIYARRFDANGTALGADFRVNATTANDQTAAQVAMNASGDFVIAWQSAAQDGDGNGIYAQLYGATGTVLKSEFLVNTVTASEQTAPAVTMNADGFVAAWESLGQDGDGKGIYARRYDASGAALGSEFQVNAETAKDQSTPAVSMNADGFVVAWESAGQDGGGKGIYAQRYDATGAPLGGEFRANTTTVKDQAAPAVALNADNASVLTWQSYAQDKSWNGVFAQRYLGNSVTSTTGGGGGAGGGGGGALDLFSGLLCLPALMRRRQRSNPKIRQ